MFPLIVFLNFLMVMVFLSFTRSDIVTAVDVNEASPLTMYVPL